MKLSTVRAILGISGLMACCAQSAALGSSRQTQDPQTAPRVGRGDITRCLPPSIFLPASSVCQASTAGCRPLQVLLSALNATQELTRRRVVRRTVMLVKRANTWNSWVPQIGQTVSHVKQGSTQVQGHLHAARALQANILLVSHHHAHLARPTRTHPKRGRLSAQTVPLTIARSASSGPDAVLGLYKILSAPTARRNRPTRCLWSTESTTTPAHGYACLHTEKTAPPACARGAIQVRSQSDIGQGPIQTVSLEKVNGFGPAKDALKAESATEQTTYCAVHKGTRLFQNIRW